MQMDYGGDNIMDCRLWSMSEDTNVYEEHLYIPVTYAHSNITFCSPWLVCAV
jgi:hypothetical protein